MDLAKRKCVPCEGGTKPLDMASVSEYLKQTPNWTSPDGKTITRNLKFKDFKEAMIFVNKVAEIAEQEGHHPDMLISYNKVDFKLMTHAIGGLSDNDFILAAKINELAG